MIDNQNPQNDDVFKDFDDGLFVRVPRQDSGAVVKIKDKKDSKDPPSTDDFTVIRHLPNFWIEDDNGVAVLNFSPPMELLVRFTQDYLVAARDIIAEKQKNDGTEAIDVESEEPDVELVFAYFDPDQNGEAGGWVRLPRPGDTLRQHTFFEDFDGFGGFRGFQAITVTTWPDDPGTAWGV